MGSYDIYGDGIQLKVGPCECDRYNAGDIVPIDDGVYVTPEGVVVVHGGRLLCAIVTSEVVTKWGDVLNLHDLLDTYNPVAQAIRDVKKELGTNIEVNDSRIDETIPTKFYICPECGELVTNEDIHHDCESGGVGLCNCDFTMYDWDGDIGELTLEFPRVYHDYVEISEQIFASLNGIQNAAARLKAFGRIPRECCTFPYATLQDKNIKPPCYYDSTKCPDACLCTSCMHYVLRLPLAAVSGSCIGKIR